MSDLSKKQRELALLSRIVRDVGALVNIYASRKRPYDGLRALLPELARDEIVLQVEVSGVNLLKPLPRSRRTRA